LANTRSD